MSSFKDHFSAQADGAEDAAGQVHVEFAGAPEPGVVGKIDQQIGPLVGVGEFLDMPANEMGDDRFVADVDRESGFAERHGRG